MKLLSVLQSVGQQTHFKWYLCFFQLSALIPWLWVQVGVLHCVEESYTLKISSSNHVCLQIAFLTITCCARHQNKAGNWLWTPPKFSCLIIIFNLKRQMENVYFEELGCYFSKVNWRMIRQHSKRLLHALNP